MGDANEIEMVARLQESRFWVSRSL